MRTSLLLILVLAACSKPAGKKDQGGLAPSEALKSLSVAEGFQVELFASEPLIADPVAMEVDEDGNMYVVEMHGYPLDKSGSGIIKLLRDVNGDGLPDKAIEFARGLTLPSGIMRWKKGVLVTDMPNLLYLEDTNGDQVADIRDTIITGMALSNPQHNGNTPMYGPDNWVYIAHETSIEPVVYKKEFGDEGSPIRFVKGGHKATLPLNANGRNIRLKPDQGLLEMCSGESQFGQTFDPRGHHFFTANANHVFHETIAARYLKLNPLLEVGGATADIPDHGNAAKVFPITVNPHIELLTDVGVITSSCGITWYQGGLFPDSFNQVTFIAEPVHNIVHADRIRDQGSSFVASRVYGNREFLASTDPWFRPVQFYIGPDGALYVIDYYREYIEHPEWMSEEVAASGQLYNGHTKGRIYRITPTESKTDPWLGRKLIDHSSAASMAQALSSKNIWWRRNAQRLMVAANDREAGTLVKTLIDPSASPETMISALWSLEGLSMLDADLLSRALLHKDPGVRETAVRLSEGFLPNPALEKTLATLADDPDDKVRYQLLCTSGFFSDNSTVGARILDRNLDDHWFRIAALASFHGKEGVLLKSMLGRNKEGVKDMIASAAALISMKQNAREMDELIGLASAARTAAPEKEAILSGITQVVSRLSSLDPGLRATLTATATGNIRPSADPALREASSALLVALDQRDDAGLKQLVMPVVQKDHPDKRFLRSCIELSALYPEAWNTAVAERYLQPDQPADIQAAAVSSMVRSGSIPVNWLLAKWDQMPNPIRKLILELYTDDDARTTILLDYVSEGKIPPSALPWPTQVNLMNHGDLAIRKRARELLTKGMTSRDDALKEYEASLKLKGDRVNGATMFSKNCSICHQINNQGGVAFGPDLASVANRDPFFILSDIIKPDRSIADGYEWWEIGLNNGKSLSGIIASETATSIALRDPSGKEQLVSRSSIRSMQASQHSVMPAGLEKQMTVQEMADLIAYLKSNQD
jgi:putative membrane-bound dehydrogenase-like protein